MPQLSLYLEEPLMERLRVSARAADCSLSKYVRELLAADDAASRWPKGFFDLYGCVDDESFTCPEDDCTWDPILPLDL